MSRAGEAPVTLVCPPLEGGCGEEFQRSARYVRMIRDGRYSPLCGHCARARRGAGARVTFSSLREPVTDTERRYMLERFTDEQIAELASIIFNGPYQPDVVASAREELALAASAAPAAA